MIRFWSKAWTGLALVGLLSGCATVGSTPAPLGERERLARWEARQIALQSISSWNLRGKMAVRTGPKGGSATLKWNYADSVERIELYGPFGGGRVIINADVDGAVLRDTKGNSIVGNSADDVLYQRLGWQVPFDHMSSWARGLPSPGASQIEIDDQGRLESLIQDNWQVEYQGYESVRGSAIDNLVLPSKIRVSALPGTMEIYSDEGEYLGDKLNVRVILKRWWDIKSNADAVVQ